QSLPYQVTRFQRLTSQVEMYQLEGTQGTPVSPPGFQSRSWAVRVAPRTGPRPVPSGWSPGTCTDPRLRARLPWPLERARPWLATPAGAEKAAALASTTPDPTAIGAVEAAAPA